MIRKTLRAQAASVITFLILLIVFFVIRLTTFQATFQRVHFQADILHF